MTTLSRRRHGRGNNLNQWSAWWPQCPALQWWPRLAVVVTEAAVPPKLASPEQLVLLFRRTSESNCPNIASERASGGFFSKDLAPGFTGPDGWFRVQMGPGLGASRRTTDQRFLQRDFEHADSYYMLLCLCPIFVDKHHRKYEEFIRVFESLGIRTSRGSSEKYPAREFMDRAVHDFRQNPLQLSH